MILRFLTTLFPLPPYVSEYDTWPRGKPETWPTTVPPAPAKIETRAQRPAAKPSRTVIRLSDRKKARNA